ncbi:glycosyltransferase [Sphingobium lignivorans]|uniref:Glycosyltransferase involved in cell wall biosynthesis n=1 Tax=Sphingobium lignivorans TaxID=2735886 RepID=A0ABR6NCN7_9SPHN|nr:glycosyltransferase [Sphingobium lignivorans]MBB5985033.1 glycosyltransferase involved in cell wall biosynthesis [Sphingobium lignivorans]
MPAGASLPARARAIWQERQDLQTAFDLHTRAGVADLYWWYILHGFAEMGLQFDPVGDRGLLAANRPHPKYRQRGPIPVTWLMHRLAHRSPLSTPLAHANALQQNAFFAWLFARGLSQTNLGALLDDEQASHLLAPDDAFRDVPRLLTYIWSVDETLATRFMSPSDPQFRAWCACEGSRIFPILSHPKIMLARPPSRIFSVARPFGVNLFGHIHGRSGVSEDVRMAAYALDAVDIPYSLHNVSPGITMPDEEQGFAEAGDLLPFAFNMFCMSPLSTAAEIMQRGRALFADYYNVGFWPWELSEMPLAWRDSYDLVDEVWASSRFTYDAYCRSSPKPVRHLPMAVSVRESSGLDRSAFNLPAIPFLFGFAFDGLSSYARKAPGNCITAFHKAFGRDDESVGLVIKALRSDNPEWQALVSEEAHDHRIRIITESLTRADLLDLWRSLDCFVSLHRSEGFGRNIAEAMLLGKPVIATAHSGNMDFTTHGTAALVAASLCQVGQGQYPFGAGQTWADPDLDMAARHMRRMVEDSVWRDDIAHRGQALVADRYSAQRVGGEWQSVLRAIYE